MSDTLEIFGTEYTGVTGIKATDDNSQTKTYIRPQGSLSISSNNTYDVTAYAEAVVNVSGGYVTQDANGSIILPSTGGGGGSSDFSTAQVTVSATSSFYAMLYGVVMDISAISDLPANTLPPCVTYLDFEVTTTPQTIDAILYQGTALFIVWGQTANGVSITGSATKEEYEGGGTTFVVVTITGDCTIVLNI